MRATHEVYRNKLHRDVEQRAKQADLVAISGNLEVVQFHSPLPFLGVIADKR
jgi:hypothetical protein